MLDPPYTYIVAAEFISFTPFSPKDMRHDLADVLVSWIHYII